MNKTSPSSTKMDYKNYQNIKHCSPGSVKPIIYPSLRHLLQDTDTKSMICASEIISELPGYHLKSKIECRLSKDEDGSFIIECPELKVYSSGDSRKEAVENIIDNIVTLYEDLMENDDYSDDWLEIKQKLKSKIL